MKKIAIILMCALMLTGCTSVKSGMGISSARSAVNASEEGEGRAKAKATCCYLSLDKKGIVKSISIDAAEIKFDFNNEGKITSDIKEDVLTNKELGDDYGLKKKYPNEGEWHEQVKAFEEWAVGKDINYVLNAENEVLPEGSKDKPIKEIVTMDLTEILNSVQKAYDNILAQTEAEENTQK